jgi:glycerol-3-phosphate dehydrogenase subunit B
MVSGREFDLIIIGSGLAGTAAACFAMERGLKTAQVSATGGELTFASGLLDLLAIYPPEKQTFWKDPWDGIVRLIAGSPQHPYARLGVDAIREAMEQFLTFLESAGLKYYGLPDGNVTLVTAAGTLKQTYRVPHSMWHGVIALQDKLPTLIVDLVGMNDFNAGLIVEMLKPRWPTLRALRISFPLPFLGLDRQNLLLAEALESAEVRERLADVVRPHLADVQFVGMPAVLGLRSSARIISDLEYRLGVGIFEIPTLPPSVPGFRLREAADTVLSRQGVVILQHRHVMATQTARRCCYEITIGAEGWRETLKTEGVILATGRFLGRGLAAGPNGVSETVFGLPVTQPPARSLWHRERFLDHRGHPLNEAGLEIDDRFRPLETDRSCAFENVFAAGSVLAHQDWMRTKSGAGLAISTAYGAVEAFIHTHSRYTR